MSFRFKNTDKLNHIVFKFYLKKDFTQGCSFYFYNPTFMSLDLLLDLKSFEVKISVVFYLLTL